MALPQFLDLDGGYPDAALSEFERGMFRSLRSRFLPKGFLQGTREVRAQQADHAGRGSELNRSGQPANT